MKTPEEMAEEYSNSQNCLDDQTSRRHAFLAGFEAGREMTDQEIVDFIIDMREREAKEKSKAPLLQQERHDHIWDKVKVKLIGIF